MSGETTTSTLTGWLNASLLSALGGRDFHQPVRCPVRQRAQQHGVDDAEDCGVRADTERKRHECHHGEAGPLHERSERESKVLPHGGHAPGCAERSHPALSGLDGKAPRKVEDRAAQLQI